LTHAQAAASEQADGTSATAQVTPDEVSSEANLAVAVDAETGNLRAATAAEIRQLELARAQSQRMRALSASASTSARGIVQRLHASGARGARLNDDFMHFSVVTVEGGRLVASCLHANEQEAAIAHRVKAPRLDQKNQLPTE
jgi:hypothetical protein